MKNTRLVLIGERNVARRGHQGIEASLVLYQRITGEEVRYTWVRSDGISTTNLPEIFAGATGAWCVPGSPYASTEGALNAIRYGRENHLSFLGTCGGFQHALMEYCANVLNKSAGHQEMDANAQDPLIVKLSCPLIEAQASVHATPESAYEKILGAKSSIEEFHCSYGVAPTFEPLFADSEIEFIARNDARQVRVFRHKHRAFFFGSLFQPERRSLQGTLHPLVHAFLSSL
jgi:CTP synthase (UTP-ammonia lyase)